MEIIGNRRKKYYNRFFTFQRFLLSITPEKEQQDIIDGKPGKRANLNHWISL